VAGVEALLRLKHYEDISPAVFLDIARRNGLKPQINEIVFQKGLAQIELWKTLNVNYGRLAINISATELSKKNFRGRMLDFCQTHLINPKNVEIEVIEIAKLINTSENQL